MVTLCTSRCIIVVSDIGEQWSPHTAPAIQADIDIIIIVLSVPENVLTTIGIRIPNVPQLVPVANARNIATRNIMAGRKLSRLPEAPFTRPATYSLAPKLSVILLSVHAKVRIRIAGTIALKPSGMQANDSLNGRTFLTA